MAAKAGDDGFSAYTGAVPAPELSSPISSTSPSSPASPTFDFKVIILRANELFSSQDRERFDATSAVYVQLEVLDVQGVPIAAHFKYKSTVKQGPNPEWCESVLLKHLPIQPCTLSFTLHATTHSTPPVTVALGSLHTPAPVIARFHPPLSPSHSVYSQYHRVSGGQCGPNAQFHFVIAPAYARLRHLTATQSKPPLLPSLSPHPQHPSPALIPSPASGRAPSPVPVESAPRRTPSPLPIAQPVKPPPALVTQPSLLALLRPLTGSGVPAPLDVATPQGLHFQANPLLTPAPPLPSPSPVSPGVEAALTPTSLAKRAHMRQRAVQEFYDTERSYFVNLGILVNEFVLPLKAAVAEGRIRVADGVVEKVVNNVETIHKFHRSFVSDLEHKAVLSPTSPSSPDSAAPESSIAEVVLKYSAFLKLYVIYLNGYEDSLSAINGLRSNRRFQEFLTKMRERLLEISILDLTSFLIMPVQRVPRYVLLLDAILKYTSPSHPEYPRLLQALDSIKAVATYVNEGKRHVENLSKLVDVQDRVSGSGVPQLVEPFRRFIREGVMTRLSVGMLTSTMREKKSIFFLFSDLILWTGVDHKFKDCLWLVSAALDLSGKERRQLALTTAKVHLVIRFDSDDDCRQWSDDIERMIADLQAERNKHRVLYRDLKSRRKVNGDTSNSPTASHPTSGAATPVHSVDGSAPTPMHQTQDNVHSLISEKLRELQVRKEQEGVGADEVSVSSARRLSGQVTAYHTHSQSIDVDASTPHAVMGGAGGGVGALEKRAWKGTAAAFGTTEEMSVRGMASAKHNVCICADREEGRRNSALLRGRAATDGGSTVVDDSKRCPLHRLPAG